MKTVKNIFILALFVFVFSSCGGLKDLDGKIRISQMPNAENQEITEIGDRIKANMSLKVQNDANKAIRIKYVKAKVHSGNYDIFNINERKEIVFSKGESEVNLPIIVNTSALFEMLMSGLQGNDTGLDKLTVDLDARVKYGLLSKRVKIKDMPFKEFNELVSSIAGEDLIKLDYNETVTFEENDNNNE